MLIVMYIVSLYFRSLDKYYFSGMESVEIINVTMNYIDNINNLSLSDSDQRDRPLPIRTLT